MLTVLSDTQVRALSDSIAATQTHLDTMRTLLAASQTLNFQAPEAPAKAVKATFGSGARKSAKRPAESQVKTHKTRRGRGQRALTAKQVLEIKRQLASGVGASSLSREYKVHLTSINNIKWGKTWKQVTLQQATPVTVHQ
jgi:hypothetical protein